MKNSTKGRLLTAFLIFLVFLLFTILFRRHLREGGPLTGTFAFLDTSVPYPYVDTTYATQSKPSDETTYTLDATPTKPSDETTYTFLEVTGETTTPSAVNAHTTLPDKVTTGETTCSDDPHWVMTGRKGKTRKCDWVKKNKHQRCGYHTNKKTLQTRLLPRIGTGDIQSDVACAKACGTCKN